MFEWLFACKAEPWDPRVMSLSLNRIILVMCYSMYLCSVLWASLLVHALACRFRLHS